MKEINNYEKFPKGSEWRKWDLQCCTNKYNNYKGLTLSNEDLERLKIKTGLTSSQINSDHIGLSNEEYAKLYIEYLVCFKDIEVIAITNHNTGDGIQEILDYLNSKKDYKKVGLRYNRLNILPGLEIGGNDKCHILIIFNPNTSIDKKYKFNQDKEKIGEKNWNEYIDDFLNDIKILEPRFDKGKKPCNSISIGAKEILDKATDWDFIAIFPHINKSDGIWTELQENNKKSLYNHKYFGIVELTDSNKNTDLQLILDGKHTNWGIKKVAKIKTSDSKSLNEIGNDFTWIKADPTFNGLKQIIYEPEDRVYIGKTNPNNLKMNSNQIVKSIKIKNSNDWFPDTEILFNNDLVGIIGGRGAGKTALLDLLAFGTYSYDPQIKSSFLQKASKELSQLEIQINWNDNNIDTTVYSENLFVDCLPKTKYLSQSFVDKLCSEDGIDELKKEIENIIFQNIPDNSFYENFNEYKNDKLNKFINEKNRIKNEILNLNVQISDCLKMIEKEKYYMKEKKQSEINLKTLVDSYNKIKLNINPTEKNEKLIKELTDKHEEAEKIKHKIYTINQELRYLQNFKSAFTELYNYNNKQIEFLKNELYQTNLDKNFINQIGINYSPENLIEIIKSFDKKINDDLNTQNNELNKLNNEIELITKKLNIDETYKKSLDQIRVKGQNLKLNITNFNNELDKINKLKKLLPHLEESRNKFILKYFDVVLNERKEILKMYSYTSSIINSGKDDATNLFSISFDFNFDIDKFCEIGNEIIDHKRTGEFQQKDFLYLKDKINNYKFDLNFDKTQKNKNYNINNSEYEKIEFEAAFNDNIQNDILNFYKNINNIFKKDQLEIKDQIKNNDILKYYNWLYSLDYYSIYYTINYNNIKLENLSPGTRGIALLILYLELDKSDTRPLLIDQPEENLDNRSVYKSLVNYFKEAKKRRQIIMVTHNPNLIVNTDSEQIIVANFDKNLESQETRINYVSSGLECSFENKNEKNILLQKGIREHVCEILEGGEEAFEKRENKYGFKK